MPSQGQKLVDHLQALEATRYELVKAVADWHQLLAEKKNQMLYPKDKDKTEMDRRVMLNASVAVIEHDYVLLCRLEELIRERIELGKVILTLPKQ